MSSALPSYAEAARFVTEWAANRGAVRVGTERVRLSAAAGRVTAEELKADRAMPPFPRSTRDGFACRALEASQHAWLRVAGSTRAGQAPAGNLSPGAAWEIMTGAPVPAGADAIAMVEHVERDGDRIRLMAPRTLESGENIVPEGAEARSGALLVPIGARLGPPQIAVAATCGYDEIEVFARPRVAILTTGDELVPVASQPGPGQIRNSNAPMLASLVSQAGGEPWILPAVRDEAGALEAALREALTADLLLISGGVSAGKFDLVEPALAALGARFHFTGVRIQPGKPLVFGEVPREDGAGMLPFFGLPGNPISSAATFLLFGTPVLGVLAGSREQKPQFAVARLAREIKGKPGLTRFVPSFAGADGEGGAIPSVSGVFWQGSGDLAAFARSNCFVLVPEGIESLPPGELVRILQF